MEKLPKITIAMPTFNSEQKIEKCLSLIRKNNYPQKKIEIIIADGGSSDKTIEIAKKYNCIILKNERKLPEPGKAVCIENASGELICFLDDDNYLSDKHFFQKIVQPFLEDKEIIAAEPWEYTYSKSLNPLERYWAMIGVNDPILLSIGAFDRKSFLNNSWTKLNVKQEDKGGYIKIWLESGQIPTIGANGFTVRRNIIRKIDFYNLLDLDKVAALVENGDNIFAKVKVGIVHTFATNINLYFKKADRKAKQFSGIVTYPSQSTIEKTKRLYTYPNIKAGVIKFILKNILILPLIYESLKLFIKSKGDYAAFYHPIINFGTLAVYAKQFSLSFLKIKRTNY